MSTILIFEAHGTTFDNESYLEKLVTTKFKWQPGWGYEVR